MKFFLPENLSEKLFSYENSTSADSSVFQRVNLRLDRMRHLAPVVSVAIIAYNEEDNVLRCVDSISSNIVSVPFEIIIVNNNSTDRTQKVIDKLNVKTGFQSVQGCGVSRELAQQLAAGKYILTADADCLYPPKWIESMYQLIKEEGVSCVYGNYGFLSRNNRERRMHALHSYFKDLSVTIRHIKRPYLNCLGMSMAYERNNGVKIGFITQQVRGEDGRLAYDLMKHGRIVRLNKPETRVWSENRTLLLEGSLTRALFQRFFKELLRLPEYLTKHRNHDPKLKLAQEHTEH